MQFVVVNVDLEGKMEFPEPKLEIGEHIVTKVVELSNLKAELDGNCSFLISWLISHSPIEYDRKVNWVKQKSPSNDILRGLLLTLVFTTLLLVLTQPYKLRLYEGII